MRHINRGHLDALRQRVARLREIIAERKKNSRTRVYR
jgi:hypothetical protein